MYEHVYIDETFYNINKCMAAKEVTPNMPKILLTRTVKILIGTCSPIEPPNTFKKNNNNTPMVNRIAPCPSIFDALEGARIMNNTITKPIMPIMIIVVVFILHQPLFTFISFYVIKIKNRTDEIVYMKDCCILIS